MEILKPSEADLAEALRRIGAEAKAKTGTLDLSRLAIERLPDELAEVPHVTTLFCNGDFDCRLPLHDIRSLSHLAALEMLNCGFTQIRSLSGLEACRALKLLNCNRTPIRSLRGLNACTALNSLQCCGTEITSLCGLASCNALNSLECDSTDITSLSALHSCPALMSLSCSYTKVTDLKWLEACTALNSLNCRRTLITSLKSLDACIALTSLDCSANQITSLRGLEACIALTSLDCSFTQIVSLRGLEASSSLTSLDCRHAQITGLQGLEACTALASLDCSHTEITSLCWLKDCTALASLDCSCTEITSLTGLEACNVLTSLNCSHTQVTNLSALKACAALTSLDCSGTEITSLKGLEACNVLTSLNCSQTQLTNLSALKACTALASLDCSHTLITSLRWLEDCTALASLDCNDTELTSLKGLEACNVLTSLNCSYTQVTSLRALKACTSLTSLRLNETRLLAIQHHQHGIDRHVRTVLSLPHLDFTDSQYARIRGIPDELQSQKHDENSLPRLRNYIATLDADPRDVRALRLFILGNGAVGKTQVRRTLLNQSFEQLWNSTHGIETETLALSGAEGERYQIDLWDFGGQEIYHGTHALFLQKAAVFVLCWTPEMESGLNEDHYSTTSENQPLAYWLDYAGQFGGDEAQILILQTRCNDPVASAPLPLEIPAELASRVQVLQIDNKARSTRGQLVQSVLKAASAIIDTTGVTHLPGSWLDISEQLGSLRRQKPDQRLLPMAEYIRICETSGLSHGQSTLLHFLDATGIILQNPSLAGNQIILDPSWALDGVYALLARDGPSWHALTRNAGRFTAKELGHWFWNSQNLTTSEQRALLDFMVRAGICFAHRDTEGAQDDVTYISPAFLPSLPLPMVERQWRAVDPNTIGCIWPFDLLHDGLTRSLLAMVGALAKDDGDYWRKGAQFYDGTSEAVARLDMQRDPSGWSGAVFLSVQSLQGGAHKDAAAKLLQGLSQKIEDSLRRFGDVPRAIVSPSSPTSVALKQFSDTDDNIPYADDYRQNTVLVIKPQRAESDYYVSYAHCHDPAKDEAEKAIDKFVEAASAQGLTVLRDRDQCKAKDQADWVQFVERMSGKNAVVFAFVGKTYLEREWPSYEMSSVYEQHGKHDFTNRFRALVQDRSILNEKGLSIRLQQDWNQRLTELRQQADAELFNPEAAEQHRRLDRITRCLPHAFAQLKTKALETDIDAFIQNALVLMQNGRSP